MTEQYSYHEDLRNLANASTPNKAVEASKVALSIYEHTFGQQEVFPSYRQEFVRRLYTLRGYNVAPEVLRFGNNLADDKALEIAYSPSPFSDGRIFVHVEPDEKDSKQFNDSYGQPTWTPDSLCIQRPTIVPIGITRNAFYHQIPMNKRRFPEAQAASYFVQQSGVVVDLSIEPVDSESEEHFVDSHFPASGLGVGMWRERRIHNPSEQQVSQAVPIETNRDMDAVYEGVGLFRRAKIWIPKIRALDPTTDYAAMTNEGVPSHVKGLMLISANPKEV